MSYEQYRHRILAKDGKMKRILALNGGGIRGLITVQFLKKIETIIREKTGDSNALLRDHFHLIGGTSTGAIIAALAAIGKDAEEMDMIYRELGREVFQTSRFRFGLVRPKYSVEALQRAMNAYLPELTMGDITEMGVGFCAIAKRLDSGSAWVIDNNPDGKYFDSRSDSTTIPNKDYKVKKVVRASTAAPTYFQPEFIEIAPGQSGLFVDGGVSPHNNPALQLFMLATIEGYKYSWDVGESNIFVLSLGTGSWEPKIANAQEVADDAAVKTGITALNSLMNDSRELNEILMQWISKPTGPMEAVDRVVGNMANETMSNSALCSYMRFNITLEKEWIEEKLGLSYSHKDVQELRDLGSVHQLDEFAKLGQIYAEKFISAEQVL